MRNIIISVPFKLLFPKKKPQTNFRYGLIEPKNMNIKKAKVYLGQMNEIRQHVYARSRQPLQRQKPYENWEQNENYFWDLGPCMPLFKITQLNILIASE